MLTILFIHWPLANDFADFYIYRLNYKEFGTAVVPAPDNLEPGVQHADLHDPIDPTRLCTQDTKGHRLV